MNQFHLGFRLGDVNPAVYQRFYNERLVYSLEHNPDIKLSFSGTSVSNNEPTLPHQAHTTSVNCLSISTYDQGANHLATGGADAAVQLWSLTSAAPSRKPLATLSRHDNEAHTHSLTSISIYPFDSDPTLLLSTSFDKTLKLTSITPSDLKVLHTFPISYAPHTHALSPATSATPLLAVGTSHPHITLLDLRSNFPLHSLPGHNDAIYSLAWHPTRSHILCSGSADGRVLFFDVRRANAAFANLDLEDAIGVDIAANKNLEQHEVSYNSRAHNGPVTSVQFTPHPDKIVTAGHDQRIRLWDAATGRNDLVHFGPRIRNSRNGTLSPLVLPSGYSTKPSRELLLWPNDDGRGDLHLHTLREGVLVRIMKMQEFDRAKLGSEKGKSGKMTSAGRVNAVAWRDRAGVGDGGSGGVEVYSAHGDGRVGVWQPSIDEEVDGDEHGEPGDAESKVLDDEENRKKRKRELLDSLKGLTKKSMKLS